MKVAWLEAEQWHKDYIETEHEIEFFSETVQEASNLDSFDAISVFVDSEVSREVIENVRLEKILCRSAGYDNVDTEAAEELGVEIYNTPDYGSETVAEYTIALMLNTAKRLDKDLGKDPNNDQGLQGFELKNKTLGIVGAGRIGREVIKRAKAFGMEVLAYDPYPVPEAAEEIGYEYVELEEVLSEADFVSVNCPLVKSTKHLLSFDEFGLMNEVTFVNAARGPVVNSEALLEALKNGGVIYAALDVVEDGWYQQLARMENVYFTPHNAYNTNEAKKRIVDITIENLDGQNESLDL